MGAPWFFFHPFILGALKLLLPLLSLEEEGSSGAARPRGFLLLGEAPPPPEVADVVLHPWKASWADVLFAELGPTFPAPDATGDDWERFFRVASVVPLVFLLIGVVLSCCTCCYPCWRDRRRGMPAAAEPLKGPTIWWGALVVLVAISGAAIYWQTGEAAERNAQTELANLQKDVGQGNRYADDLETLGASIEASLTSLEQSCPLGVRGQVKQAVDPIIQQVQSYGDFVSKYGAKGERLHHDVKSVSGVGQRWGDAFVAAFIIPLALVLLCCLTATVATICTCTGRFTGLLVRFMAPLVFAPSLLLVTTAISLELEAGILVSSFCMDPDNNTMAYCKQYCGEDSTDYPMIKYYVGGGEGDNPLMDEVAAANSSMKEIKTKLSTLRPYTLLCPEWHDRAELEASVGKAQRILASVTELFAFSHVYPYYDKAVHDSICTTLVSGVGWIALFQIIAGLLGLPILFMAVHRYMRDKTQWNETLARM